MDRLLQHFKDVLGEERYNDFLQDSVGKTYEELLDERDALAARVEELENEIQKLREELEESRELEDPTLRAHKNFSDTISRIINPRTILQHRIEREHREGIPMDELEVIEGGSDGCN